jgi:hypothetical protein
MRQRATVQPDPKVLPRMRACSPRSLHPVPGGPFTGVQGCCSSGSLGLPRSLHGLARLRTDLRGLPAAPRLDPSRIDDDAPRSASACIHSPSPRWWRATVPRGVRPLLAPPPTCIHGSTPGRCRHRPSVERCHTPDPVPPSRFRTALTACSAVDVAGLLHPAAGHGVRRSCGANRAGWPSSHRRRRRALDRPRLRSRPSRCSTGITEAIPLPVRSVPSRCREWPVFAMHIAAGLVVRIRHNHDPRGVGATEPDCCDRVCVGCRRRLRPSRAFACSDLPSTGRLEQLLAPRLAARRAAWATRSTTHCSARLAARLELVRSELVVRLRIGYAAARCQLPGLVQTPPPPLAARPDRVEIQHQAGKSRAVCRDSDPCSRRPRSVRRPPGRAFRTFARPPGDFAVWLAPYLSDRQTHALHGIDPGSSLGPPAPLAGDPEGPTGSLGERPRFASPVAQLVSRCPFCPVRAGGRRPPVRGGLSVWRSICRCRQLSQCSGIPLAPQSGAHLPSRPRLAGPCSAGMHTLAGRSDRSTPGGPQPVRSARPVHLRESRARSPPAFDSTSPDPGVARQEPPTGGNPRSRLCQSRSGSGYPPRRPGPTPRGDLRPPRFILVPLPMARRTSAMLR